MLDQLLHPEVQHFIKENERVDISKLLLKGGEIFGVPIKDIAEQISGRLKAKRKLPDWYSTYGIVYPAKISMEQCSSELTAQYKSSIISGRIMADLTGGAGVDTFHFSTNYETVDYVEQNEFLFRTTYHNFKVLSAHNINTHLMTSELFLESNQNDFDLIYLDPARRDGADKKVFRFEDCTPDINALLPALLGQSKYVLIKTAPFLDITQALNQLSHVAEVHVVSVDNECKEVLYLIAKEVSEQQEIKIRTVNLSDTKPPQSFDLSFGNDNKTSIKYGFPNRYIYESNSSIMKSGGINQVGIDYNLDKLHPNSQLLTSDVLITEFPGRIFECIEVLKYDKKVIKKVLTSGKANISTRNFPDSVAQIRKKTGLKDGGDEYLFATTNINEEKVILRTKKLEHPMDKVG